MFICTNKCATMVNVKTMSCGFTRKRKLTLCMSWFIQYYRWFTLQAHSSTKCYMTLLKVNSLTVCRVSTVYSEEREWGTAAACDKMFEIISKNNRAKIRFLLNTTIKQWTQRNFVTEELLWTDPPKNNNKPPCLKTSFTFRNHDVSSHQKWNKFWNPPRLKPTVWNCIFGIQFFDIQLIFWHFEQKKHFQDQRLFSYFVHNSFGKENI